MLELHQPPRAFDAPNASPFCTKLETLLRMGDIEYQIVPVADPRNGPTGKIPWIVDNGNPIGDSRRARQYLEETRNIDFDEGLSESERAQSLAFIRLSEEHLYWSLVYSRWAEDESWPLIRDAFFSSIPSPLRGLVSNMVRKKVVHSISAHGLGRHDRDAVYEFARADLAALSGFLGEKPYFFGEQPTALDASAFGQLCSLVRGPFDMPAQAYAKGHQNLVAFVERMEKRYFPDLAA